MKNISVFGLGYVGCVSVACLAKAGHKVIGVDVDISKTTLVSKGMPTVVEPQLDSLLMEGFKEKRISATTDAEWAIQNSDIVIIAVGTPSDVGGGLDLSNILKLATTIGVALATKTDFLTITIRSTVKPGTCKEFVQTIERVSGKTSEIDFSVSVNPEFLREGVAISDYENPPFILIGSIDERGAAEVASIYENLSAEVVYVDPETAEILKYINNTWHALKVAFANEIGSVCKALNLNTSSVIDLFLKDRRLNISTRYLRPGHAFGGACLPKDLSALVALANEVEIQTPLINSIQQSNEAHIDRAISLVNTLSSSARIGFVGLSFKGGTDDLRNSPNLRIVQTLVSGGRDVCIFDPDVSEAINLHRNTVLLTSMLDGLEDRLVGSVSDLLERCDAVVFAKADNHAERILREVGEKQVVDLVNITQTSRMNVNIANLVQ